MKILKKAIRHCMFICFILIAGLAVGLSGGVPVPFQKIRRDAEVETAELVEEKNVDEEKDQFKL